MNEFDNIFPRGEVNPFGQFFTGQSYLVLLTQLSGVGVANVTFEPGCRNNWHTHHGDKGGGQILLCTAGQGWYQEWGKEAQALQPGDVVAIPTGVTVLDAVGVQRPGMDTPHGAGYSGDMAGRSEILISEIEAYCNVIFQSRPEKAAAPSGH